MTRRYGIDTSVLLRLITAQPPDSYSYCIEHLSGLIDSGAEVFASNQVIGETYIAAQHHYRVSRNDASQALFQVLSSGLVAPLNGMPFWRRLMRPAGRACSTASYPTIICAPACKF